MKSLLIFCFAFTCGNSFAQQSITAADYARAEKSLGVYTFTLVENNNVNATWINDHSFWYNTKENGYILVDAAKGTKTPVSDISKLTSTVDKTEAKKGFRDNTISPDGKWSAYIDNYNLWVKKIRRAVRRNN
jgi:hypothetical protein